MADYGQDEKQKKSKGKLHKLTVREIADLSISAYDYPYLGLGKNEYVIINIERSRIGLVYIWSVVVGISLLLIAVCKMMINTNDSFEITILAVLLGYITVFITLIIGSAESRIYRRNYMIISSQRAFTQTQIGPFATKTQVIELENIEDVVVNKSGILPSFFHYGEIRLSTEVDDSSYNLTFVKDPEKQASEIKKIVNSIKPRNN